MGGTQFNLNDFNSLCLVMLFLVVATLPLLIIHFRKTDRANGQAAAEETP